MRCPAITLHRLACRLAICIGAGAACTFLVAAGLGLYAPLGGPTIITSSPAYWAGQPSRRPPALKYPFPVPSTWPKSPDLQVQIENTGFRVDAWHATGPRVGEVSAAIYRSGWPMLAMERRQVRETRGATNRDLWVVSGAGGLGSGLAVPHSLRPLLPAQTRPFRHRMPLVPLPLGFAVNTAMAAGALYAFLYGPQHLMRAHRRTHGLCLICGYDVGPLAVCPECGEGDQRLASAEKGPGGSNSHELRSKTVPK